MGWPHNRRRGCSSIGGESIAAWRDGDACAKACREAALARTRGAAWKSARTSRLGSAAGASAPLLTVKVSRTLRRNTSGLTSAVCAADSLPCNG